MNIAVNFKALSGPSGGGISFLNALISGFESKGHKIFFDLSCKNLDIILILDPRWNHSSSAFNSKQIIKYLNRVNPKAIVVHRINECDERKNTNFMNKKLRQINYLADATIFVGKWLLDLKVTNQFSFHDLDIVIKNGANRSLYNTDGFKPWLTSKYSGVLLYHGCIDAY